MYVDGGKSGRRFLVGSSTNEKLQCTYMNENGEASTQYVWYVVFFFFLRIESLIKGNTFCPKKNMV